MRVSKHYRIGALRHSGYGTLRSTLMDAAATPLRRLRATFRAADCDNAQETKGDSLWALNDVSFKIHRGESVGIIGRNGAGKSTLLKVLSRITAPTRGKIEIRGRVGSLLEVGTGFHPELTGRENILLNGAIIGMPRREIARKFDRIVEFSEVGKFIETPVKRYSSGMYVKLAFSVAAHMEPDVLLIDEVLSVGDLAFQRKCMDHAKQMLSRNTTLLFVSHNMFSIKSLCDRAIYLGQGEVVADGPTEEVAGLYDQESRLDMASWAHAMVGSDPSRCPVRVTAIEVEDESGHRRSMFDHGERMRIRLRYQADEPIENPNFVVAVIRSDGVACCNYNTSMDGAAMGTLRGSGEVELSVPPLKLVSDQYSINILVWDSNFQRLYCAQLGTSFHVRHPLLSTEFGVYHESAEWACRPDSGARTAAGLPHGIHDNAAV